MKDTKPLPQIAVTAFQLLDANFQRSANDLGMQTLALKPDGEGWGVNWNTKLFERDVPDVVPEPPAV